MKNNRIKNFPVIYGGEEYWISRSIAVVIKVTAVDVRNNVYVLAVQRGEGTPDPEFIGSWCLPCGYLDYGETTGEAAARELFEETGLRISPEKLTLVEINDNPDEDKRQNVSFRFKGNVPTIYEVELSNKNSEEKEVSNIRWIPIKELDNYRWAFNHDKLINKI